MEIPFILLFPLIIEANISAHRTKKQGARGSPCLQLLWIRKGLEIFPFIITDEEAFLYRVSSYHLQISLPKLKGFNVSNMKQWETVSKAFSKFINNNIPGVWLTSV